MYEKFSDLIKKTRAQLGLSRQEMANLLGVSLRTLAGWEYADVVPHPVYQEMVVRLHNNADEVRQEIEQDKANYITQAQVAQYQNGGESKFWKSALVGIGIGALAVLTKVLIDKSQGQGE